jgi:ring-1,2-phenylacetyl-CoA epoxidase subunit PaaA
MFPLTVEWFGLPDTLKQHSTQLEYRLKGLTNDQLRQQWLSTVVPFLDSIGIAAPAHLENGHYALDYPFPSTFDPEQKHWDFTDPCTWDDVLARWRARGPRNAEMVGLFQESFRKFRVQS